ncbi:MSHA biogenesis protein MshJ [Parashewanella spongiae]|uniref:MSHA biogenesis protein MshJ n=1 Tax=Parashewanella spongiae TaxID=342950 RepID=A0A3A6TTC5_9GAMM|nr:MSHA biogenesis protein MshJ [Parashewanella spongiae]MCL1078236.1 MSHA biogenesis protein MshJ [Parashewanella spongiae]RJY15115.1 MSHA biogenesis protein MshJ [Parashewanella spongiae]
MKKLLIWADRFNTLSIRERSLVVTASIALVGWLCFLSLESFYLTSQRAHMQLRDLNKQNELTEQLLTNYQQQLAQDPNLDYRNQLKHVESEIQLLDDRLKTKFVDIVPSDKMPLLLQQLLSRSKGVRLIAMESIAPKPLLDFKDSETKMISLNLYRHGIKLRLNTDYFSFLTFIKSIEALPNKLYWKRLDYQVIEFPQAEVELELYTLSVSKEFISVAKAQ